MITDEKANPDPNNDADSDDPGFESNIPPLSPEDYAKLQKEARENE